MQFVELVKERRSVVKFIPDTPITHKDLEEMFNLVFAPSAFNLQHTRYVMVDDPAVKEKVYEAANKQYKIKSASAVILVLGDMDAYKSACGNK